MSTIRKGPFYNLKAVIQQTGLKADTLRAWERRYGLPMPERSNGGHRLYSQEDIETIRWLIARQREGMSISRAVELWEQIKGQGRDPLRTTTAIAAPAAPAPVLQPPGGTVARLREQWVDACLAYDEGKAEQLVNQAFTLYSPETVAVQLLQRAVAEIGEGWYRGDVSVQQEHFCSSLAIRRLEALVMAVPAPTRPGRILAACPPGEQHVIGLLLLTFLLRRRGWEVVYLGSDVPIEQLGSTVSVVQPQLVVMAAQLLHTAATLREAARTLQQTKVPLAYGGLVFNLLPTLRQRIAGHFLGERLEAAPERVEALMAAPRLAPVPETVPDRYVRALQHFQERQGMVEARVIQSLNSGSYTHNHLALANQELGQNIGAALALGGMELLGSDVEWVIGLIKNYRLPAEALKAYFRAYHRAAAEQLDERGRPIVDWLGSLVN